MLALSVTSWVTLSASKVLKFWVQSAHAERGNEGHVERECKFENWAFTRSTLSVTYLGHAERDPISGQYVVFSAHAERKLLCHAARGAPGQVLVEKFILSCLLYFPCRFEIFLKPNVCRFPNI